MLSALLQSLILAAVVYAAMFHRDDPPRLVGAAGGDERVTQRDESGASSTSATRVAQPRSPVDPEVASTAPRRPPPPLADSEVEASTTPRRPPAPLPTDLEVVNTNTTPRHWRAPLPAEPEVEKNTTSHRGRPQVPADPQADGVRERDQSMARELGYPAGYSRSDAQRREPAPILSSMNSQGVTPPSRSHHTESTASQPAASIQPVTPVRGRLTPSDHLYRQNIPQAPPTPSPTPSHHSLSPSRREGPQMALFNPASWAPDSASRPALVAPEAGTFALVGVQQPHAPIESVSLAPTFPPAAESASGHRSVGAQILPRVRTRAAAKNRKAVPRSISAPITRSVSGVHIQAVPSSSASHFGGAPQPAPTPIPSGRLAPTPIPSGRLAPTTAPIGTSHEPVANDVSEPEVVFGRHFRAFKGMASVLNEIGDPIGTHWFASESGFPIILPPPFSATPGVQLGDVYQHHTPFGDQLWVCGTASSGLWYWKPMQEGTRRADGRKLTITKTCKEPSWVL